MRDAGGAQLGARVAADRGMDERGGGQRPVGARGVVVGDHHLHAGGLRGGHLLDRGDRAVHRHQEIRAAGGEPLDGRGGEPVAVVDPARQVPVDVGPERPQRPHEHGGRADAVDVVVAVDGDPRAALDSGEDPRRPRAQPAERVERMPRLRREERARGAGVREAAPHEDLRDDVRHAELAGEPRGGGVIVRGDLEADGGRRHGRDRTAAGGRTGERAGGRGIPR